MLGSVGRRGFAFCINSSEEAAAFCPVSGVIVTPRWPGQLCVWWLCYWLNSAFLSGTNGVPRPLLYMGVHRADGKKITDF